MDLKKTLSRAMDGDAQAEAQLYDIAGKRKQDLLDLCLQERLAGHAASVRYLAALMKREIQMSKSSGAKQLPSGFQFPPTTPKRSNAKAVNFKKEERCR